MKHSFNIFQENDINYILEFYDMAIEFQTVNSIQQFCEISNVKNTKNIHSFAFFPPILLKTKLTPFLQLDNGLGPYIERTTKIGFGKKSTLFGR